MNWAGFLNADSNVIVFWLDWYLTLWLLNAGGALQLYFLFKNEMLQILLDSFPLTLDITGLNILDSIISKARECYGKYIGFYHPLDYLEGELPYS